MFQPSASIHINGLNENAAVICRFACGVVLRSMQTAKYSLEPCLALHVVSHCLLAGQARRYNLDSLRLEFDLAKPLLTSQPTSRFARRTRTDY